MSATDHVLLATTIFVRQEDGTRKQYHRGEVVPGLDQEQIERLTKCGALGSSVDLEPEPVLVVPVSDTLGEADGDHAADEDAAVGDAADAADVADVADAADADDVEEVADVVKPDRDIGKADLVTWVVDNLVHDDESPYTKSEANRLNKDELWELIDGIE